MNAKKVTTLFFWKKKFGMSLSADRCLFLCQWIRQAENCFLFAQPVDWKTMGLWDYPKIVANPMDLQTVEAYLAKGDAFDFDRFQEMVAQVWYNACLFNPEGHIVHEAAKQVQALFDNKLQDALRHPVDDDPQKLSMVFLPFVLATMDDEDNLVDGSYAALPITFDGIATGLQEGRYLNRYDVESDIVQMCDNCVSHYGSTSPAGLYAHYLKSMTTRLCVNFHADVDQKIILPHGVRMQLFRRIQSLDTDTLQDLSSTIEKLNPDAVTMKEGKSTLHIDRMSFSQFVKVDMEVRSIVVRRDILANA